MCVYYSGSSEGTLHSAYMCAVVQALIFYLVASLLHNDEVTVAWAGPSIYTIPLSFHNALKHPEELAVRFWGLKLALEYVDYFKDS